MTHTSPSEPCPVPRCVSTAPRERTRDSTKRSRKHAHCHNAAHAHRRPEHPRHSAGHPPQRQTRQTPHRKTPTLADAPYSALPHTPHHGWHRYRLPSKTLPPAPAAYSLALSMPADEQPPGARTSTQRAASCPLSDFGRKSPQYYQGRYRPSASGCPSPLRTERGLSRSRRRRTAPLASRLRLPGHLLAAVLERPWHPRRHSGKLSRPWNCGHFA